MSRINNSFHYSGFVGADPEKRFNPNNGKPIITLSLGVDGSYRNRDTGEKVERTDWFDLTVFQEGLAGIFEKYVRKGSEVHVRGLSRTQTWESKDRVDENGKPKWDKRVQFIVTEVQLGRRPKGSSDTPLPSEQELQSANADAAAAASSMEETPDIPF